jgi:predicted DNA-binding transcriptional regulator AlpA
MPVLTPWLPYFKSLLNKSDATLYAMLKKGELPEGVKIGNKRYLTSEQRAAFEANPGNRRRW